MNADSLPSFLPARRGPWFLGTVLAAVTVTVLGLLALNGCDRADEPPSLPPAGAYEHGAAAEYSQAEPVPPDGTAAALTRPLREAGWFCAQVRANADGRALWCRVAHRDEANAVRPQVAQFLLDRDDRLAWAWFPDTDADHADRPDDEVAATAAPALTAIWPGAGDRLRREIDDFNADRRTDPTVTGDGVPRTGWRDAHAEYRFDPHNGLVVTARNASVRRWPFGSEHYATSMSSAVDDLRAGGYDCFYPPQEVCNRPPNGSFQVTLRGDQIVTARFGIGSRIESGRQRIPLTGQFPRGLTFLTEAVRRPVTERIEQSRRTGTGYVGIVAGTVVIIDADAPRPGGSDVAAYFDIQIGAPLTATLPL